MSLAFDTPEERRRHGCRQLMQLREGIHSGVLTQAEYSEAATRIREKYGLKVADVNRGP